jgi:hypothetical protein
MLLRNDNSWTNLSFGVKSAIGPFIFKVQGKQIYLQEALSLANLTNQVWKLYSDWLTVGSALPCSMGPAIVMAAHYEHDEWSAVRDASHFQSSLTH